MDFIGTGTLLVWIYLLCMFLLVQYKKDTSIANFTWGGGVLLGALYSFFTMSSFLPRQKLITALIVLWASRLIFYVYIRYTGKDPRFKSWKWEGLKAFVINFVWVFGQIILIAIMSYPILRINMSETPGITYLDIIGFIIWSIGYFFEAVSDYQLFKFTHTKHQATVLNTGLWRYSRHPNYFGEILMWWGIYAIALSIPYGWTTIIAPVAITILLVFVTGIPWVEKALAQNPEYQAYKNKTSMLIPWLPKI